MTKADPSNLAYTSYYLPFHTDLPFITRSPDVSLPSVLFYYIVDNSTADNTMDYLQLDRKLPVTWYESSVFTG